MADAGFTLNADEQEREDARAEIALLEEELDTLKAPQDPCQMATECNPENIVPRPIIKPAKTSVKEPEKMSSLCWYDNEHVCIALQNGKALMYNVQVPSQGKRFLIMQNTWLNTCEFSPGVPGKKKIAVGGLDNVVSIYDVPDVACGEEYEPVAGKPLKVFEKHGGPIYAVKWLSDTLMLSGSGDKTAMLWDVSQGGGLVKEPVQTFKGHNGDVSSLETWGDANLFLSTGGIDKYAKLHDLRVRSDENSGVVATYAGHEAAVTTIKMMQVSGNTAFGTASEDGTARVWDMRTMKQLTQFGEIDETPGGATALTFSKSGAMACVGYEKGSLHAYDTLAATKIAEMSHHIDDVTCAETSPDGFAIATCSRGAEEGTNFAVWA